VSKTSDRGGIELVSLTTTEVYMELHHIATKTDSYKHSYVYYSKL